MIKGVLFDLDGVIVSTDEFHFLAWQELADNLGLYFDRNINNKLRGISRIESLNIVLSKSKKVYTDEEKQVFCDKKNDLYKKSLLSTLGKKDILPNILDLLFILKNKGVKTAVGSSSKNAYIILDKIELIHAFDAIVDGNQITKSKPDPEVFIKAARAIGLKPSECVVIEDASSGIESGKAAGCMTILYGNHLDYEISSDYQVKDGIELKEVLLKLIK